MSGEPNFPSFLLMPVANLIFRRDIWARSSPNPNVKVFIGAPASSTAAGGGYQDPATMATILTNTRKRFPSFGGEGCCTS